MEFLWPAPIQKRPAIVSRKKAAAAAAIAFLKKAREMLIILPCASIKQPDAHNFCCQTQFSICFFLDKKES